MAEDRAARRRRLRQTYFGAHLHDPAIGLLRAAEAELVADAALDWPLLDIGCGDGSFARGCLERPVTVGVDQDLERVRRARASGACAAVVVADAHRLPFRAGAFRGVVANSTLEHIPGVGDVLREAERVLEPRGRLVFTVHNQRFGERSFFWPALFMRLGLPGAAARHRRDRRRRLAMVNLMDAPEWRALLDECGLHTARVTGYLRGRSNAAFEVLLVLARLGVGRAHLSGGLRLVARALDRCGLRLHRRLAGRLWARLLGRWCDDPEGEPAAILIESEPAAAAGVGRVLVSDRFG